MDQVGNGGNGTAVGLLAGLPGRDLQAALALIDRHELSGAELALVIRARARLLAWVQAESAADVTEFVHCPAWSRVPTARVTGVQEFACDELALLLHVAPMTGKNLLLHAVDLVERHPRLWAALSDGLIDTRKVAAITTVTPDTDDALAAAVDDVLLNTAVRADGSTALARTIAETPRVLGLRTQRILSMLDPSWVRAIRREALGRRRLAKGAYGIGVGYLGLYDIGVPAMAAAYEHVNAIARGIKRLGDDRTLDQLRADTASTSSPAATRHPCSRRNPRRGQPSSAPPVRPPMPRTRRQHQQRQHRRRLHRHTQPNKNARMPERPRPTTRRSQEPASEQTSTLTTSPAGTRTSPLGHRSRCRALVPMST